ncbi:MAG: sigma factor [Eisenbergiella massiliensis]
MRITKEKFADLIREYKLPMYRLSYGILQNEMDAEDAVGEAVIKAYEHLDSLRGDR